MIVANKIRLHNIYTYHSVKCQNLLKFQLSQLLWLKIWMGEGGNRSKFSGFSLAIFCHKEFEIFALCKSVTQSEATFIVYSEPIASGHVKIDSS